MMRYSFDTGTAGDYVNHRRGVYERASLEVSKGNSIGVCVPVLGELIDGIEYSQSRDRNWQKLQVALTTWTVWPYEIAAAREYGRLRAELRRRG